MNWYIQVFARAFDFNGRARRKEFWYFSLFNLIVMISLIVLERNLGLVAFADEKHQIGPLTLIYALIALIPGISVQIRRLHDIGRTGWWILISMVPILGPLVMLYFNVHPSQEETNEYGSNPCKGS